MAAPTNARSLKDNTLIVSAALPNAANQVNTNSLDLGQATPYPLTERIQVLVQTTAGNGANSKNINVAIQESADNSTFTNISNMGVMPVLSFADNAGGGYAAQTATFQLPVSTKRYIRFSSKGEANGGDASNGTMTVSLLF
jgi:hypothetical protein